MSRNYTAALIGCGRMGATIDDEVQDRPDSFLWLPYSHAAGYTAVEQTSLVAVSDVDAERAETIRSRFAATSAYTDYREMIEKERPDIVSIATRPGTHAEITVFAAEHGVKGIYCEKPLCCSMGEADAMVDACLQHGVKFNYGTQRRYMPLFQSMRKMAQGGNLGRIECVIGHCGVGAAQWGHTHTTDMLLCLAGDGEVDFVQGTIVASDDDWQGNRLLTDPGISNGYIRFANGVHGYILSGSGFEFEVSGSNGKLRSMNNGALVQWRTLTDPWNLLEERPMPEIARESGTVNGIRDIVRALDNGVDTQGNILLARRSQEMIFGLIASDRSGGQRVPLPLEDRDLYVGRDDW
ncbi:MAG: Gfo/Idh/MocA family oxidoreductase [Candidatus Latescibacteria bacterium]|nr:Gfo/Idh/MocA family oxidoreductase [Candidatus Latescibacterota bacterium]